MDPLSNFLNKLKMASRRGAESFSFPASRIIVAVAGVLEEKGYIESAKKSKKGYSVEIRLRSSAGDARRVTAIKRISRLSQRVYRKARDIRPVRNGFGIAVLSTPKGVLTDTDARTARVGGEVLFEIW